MGHDFGEVLTERDRRERGDEVVVTVREYRECDRCGDTRVVSENKEVRRASDPEPAPGGVDPDGETSEPTAAAGAYDDVTAEEDDGVILEDEPVEREPGAWPEADDTGPAVEAGDDEEPAPWPEVAGEDEGFAAEAGDDEPLEGVEFGSGLTPEAASPEPGAADAGGDVVESTAGGTAGGFRRSARARTGAQRTVVADTELVCPECGTATPTENSSLRSGDICPECHLGYLSERER